MGRAHRGLGSVASGDGTFNFFPYNINKLGTTEDYFLVLATE